MIQYKIAINNPEQHFIQFDMSFVVKDKDEVRLQLPVWRPGRYELGYFAKNIRKFQVGDENNVALPYEKVGHIEWLIRTAGVKRVTVSYEYFANELNAGSTYLDEKQLYINPVNCFFYLPDFAPHQYDVNFALPKNYKMACSLKKNGDHGLKAKDHWELFDSPLIASPSWQKKSYEVSGCKFHILFQGICKPDWKRIIDDFEKFTKKQIQCFGGFPVKEYWYLVQMPSYRHYHGVEHEKSTVIALGPGYSLMTEPVYDNFLGVCSHELYHTWNVKNIKPREFSPYDFSKENYNRVGYIIEGVTTYMGDKMLWKSGVKSEAWFLNEMANKYKRHMWNDGRNNHSVRESSFDTWLDGYVAGIPGRKVSIYTEGALLAFIMDIEIQTMTDGKKSLDTVMKLLYKKFGSSAMGYEEDDFWIIVEKVAGKSMRSMYNHFHNKGVSYDKKLKATLKKVGLKVLEDNSDILRSGYGLIVDEKNKVVKVHPKSMAMKLGVSADDVILAVNGHVIDGNLAHWIAFYGQDASLEFILNAQGLVKKINCKKSKSLFVNYLIG